MTAERVLFVDDDANTLDSYRRVFRKRLRVDTALGAKEALVALEHTGPYAVVVADLRMPGMDGIALLTEARRRTPDTIRIMLTGHADLEAAVAAVNEGHIFQFLTKPCAPATLEVAVRAGIAQHRLVAGERELIQKTLNASVKVLTDMLAMVNPAAFGRASRLRRLARQIAEELAGEVNWEVELAAMLSQLGCVTVPEETLLKAARGMPLDAIEMATFLDHPRVGHDLIVTIPRLEGVAAIIRYQEKRYDGGGPPADLVRGQAIPLGARILKVALDLDALQASGMSPAEALDEMERRAGWYDLTVLQALVIVLAADLHEDVHYVTVDSLATGMILAQDVFSASGILLVAQGQEVTPSLRMRLTNIKAKGGLTEPLRVLVRPTAPAGPKGESLSPTSAPSTP